MKITVLSANKSSVRGIKKDKGQSLLIQTENHNFLFDFGTGKTVLANMKKLGISPEIIDVAVLSCGNALHSGGLMPFLKENRRAVVYARVNAFNVRYKQSAFGLKEITPDKQLRAKRRILRCKNYFASKDNSFVTFSVPNPSAMQSSANAAYFTKDEKGNFIPDDFSHEMYLLVRADRRWALFCGDAHAEIVNIVSQAQKLVQNNLGGSLEWVIGGFNFITEKGKPVSDEYINSAAIALSQTGVTYYTGHSTGKLPYACLQKALGDKIQAYAAGDVISL